MSQYKSLIKQLLSKHTLTLRVRKQFTQEQMAEALRISARGYGDLEGGKYCFSATTLLFFLSMLTPEELEAFLDEFRAHIQTYEAQEAA